MTKTEIVNQALIALGELVVTDVDTDTTKRGTTMDALWTPKLQYLLKKYRWRFATKRATLTEVEYKLNFDAQSGSFTIGNVVYGATSGAYGTIAWVTQNGTTGTLWLYDVVGAFIDDEIIYEASYDSDLVTTDDLSDAYWTKYHVTADDANTITVTDETDGTLYTTSGLTVSASSYYIMTFTPDFGTVSVPHFAAYDLSNLAYIFSGDLMSDGVENTKIFATPSGCVSLRPYFFRLSDSTGTMDIDSPAVKKITNAALANGTNESVTPINEYDNRYALPSDYIHFLSIYPRYIDYKIESNFILCSESDTIDIRYIYNVTDPDEFDSAFVEAFAALLARESAVQITDSLRKREKMDEMFEDKVADARFAGSIEEDPEQIEILEEDDWLQARY